MIRICNPWLSPVQILDRQGILAPELLEFRIHIRSYQHVHILRCLVRHESLLSPEDNEQDFVLAQYSRGYT